MLRKKELHSNLRFLEFIFNEILFYGVSSREGEVERLDKILRETGHLNEDSKVVNLGIRKINRESHIIYSIDIYERINYNTYNTKVEYTIEELRNEINEIEESKR